MTEKNSKFILWIAFIFTSLILILSPFYHELSLDEARPWLIAKGSSVKDLLHILSYEAHPPLWYLLLGFFSKFFESPVTVQVLSAGFGILTTALLLFRSPFTIFQKLLLTLNVFIIYQFSVVARLYSLEVFLCFMICSLFADRWEKRFWYLSVLGLLCATSVFGIAISAVLFGEYLMGYLSSERKRKKSDLLIAALLVIYSLSGWFILSIATDSYASAQMKNIDLLSVERWMGILSHIGAAFFIIAPFDGSIWGSAAGLNHELPRFSYSILALALLVITIHSYRKDTRFLYLFCGLIAGVIGIISQIRFSTFNFNYYGQVVVVWLMSAWISRQSKNFLMTGFLILQAIAGAVHFTEDFRKPYSQGKETASYLKANGVEEIIPGDWFFTTSYLVYSDAKFYDIPNDELTNMKPSLESLFPQAAYNFSSVPRPYTGGIQSSNLQPINKNIYLRYCRGNGNVRVVTNGPVTTDDLIRIGLKSEATFTGAIHPSENFYVYGFEKPASSNPFCAKSY